MDTVKTSLRATVFLIVTVFAVPLYASQGTVLVLGDSLSAAYGVQVEKAWVSLLRQRLSDVLPASWQVVNASISGETTDGGLRRLPELLTRHAPDVVIIELGGNDGLRGFSPSIIESNLSRLIALSQDAGARPLLVGIRIPPNYGPRYTSVFADIYPTLAARYQVPLVPFFLDGIYNQDGMMQRDGIHPTAEAQPRLLDNVWPHLETLLE